MGGGGQHADYQSKRIKKEHKDAHNFCHKEVVSAVHGGCSYILIITKNRHKGSAFSIIAEISFYIFNEKGEKMFPAWLVC